MVESIHSELGRLGRAARREFSHALMSDTKWRKLFAILADPTLELRQMRVKFMEVDEARAMEIPPSAAADIHGSYVDTIEFGPVELRAMEWLEVPAVASVPRGDHVVAKAILQDLDRVEVALSISGQYPIERSEGALRIIGYRR